MNPSEKLIQDVKLIVENEGTEGPNFKAMMLSALAAYHMRLAGTTPVYEIEDFYAKTR